MGGQCDECRELALGEDTRGVAGGASRPLRRNTRTDRGEGFQRLPDICVECSSTSMDSVVRIV